MMLPRILLLAAVLLVSIGSRAQSGIGMLPGPNNTIDTVIVGTSGTISALVQNQDVDSNFFQGMTVFVAVEGSGSFAVLDVFTFQQLYLDPFDTASVSFQIDFSPANGFVFGGNDLAIWAEAPGFITNDTLGYHVTVIPDPVQLLQVGQGSVTYPDTVTRDSSFAYLFRVTNGSTHNIPALPRMFLGVENSSFMVVDTNDWGGSLALSPGDSADHHFVVDYSYANGFNDGGNIVVIWPEAPPGTEVDSLRIPVYVEFGLFAGEAPRNGLERLTVYPNPTKATFQLQSIAGTQIARQVTVTDLTGRQVDSWMNTSRVDLGHLPNGVYIVQAAMTRDYTKTFRVIKH